MDMDGLPVKIAQAVCLGTSFALSGICFYVYRKRQIKVERLDGACHVNLDRQLKNTLNISPNKCLQYAVIEGTVQPEGEPLESHFQKETAGVLQKFILKEHKLVWNRIAHNWVDSERVLYHTVNAVPFVLVGSDETQIKVLHPLHASGMHTEVTHERFHKLSYNLSSIIGQYLSGEKLKGQLETEEMLKVGTTLTGVGELVMHSDGTLNLQPPSNGSEYFLSIADFGTLQVEEKRMADWWKNLALAFALAGGAFLLWVGHHYYNQHKRRWEREQARREFETLQAEASTAHVSALDDVEENIQNVCLICLSEPRNCVVLNCGHVCFCHNCYQALRQPQCPICRQNISRVVPLDCF